MILIPGKQAAAESDSVTAAALSVRYAYSFNSVLLATFSSLELLRKSSHLHCTRMSATFQPHEGDRLLLVQACALLTAGTLVVGMRVFSNRIARGESTVSEQSMADIILLFIGLVGGI